MVCRVKCFSFVILSGFIATSVLAKPAVKAPKGMDVAYLLVDLTTNSVVEAQAQNKPMIPASTSKIATALFSLDQLGLDYRFQTELVSYGNVDNGVLYGDLILKGGGDSSLDVPDVFKLAMTLKRSGIRKVQGRFLVDDSLLPRFEKISYDLPDEAPYNPSIGALSLAHNRVQLSWRNQSVTATPSLGEATYTWRDPSKFSVGALAFNPSAKSGVNWYLAKRSGKRFNAQVPVKDSGIHTGYMFKELAERLAINVPLPQRMPRSYYERVGSEQLIGVHQSAPNEKLLRDMMIYSNNMMAETLGLMSLSESMRHKQELGLPGGKLLNTLMEGKYFPNPEFQQARQVTPLLNPFWEFLKSVDPQTDWSGMQVDNFSGLSPHSRISPAQLVAMLKYGWQQGDLISLLPTNGWTGSLRRRVSGNSGQRFRVWAKTGTINYGGALAGYLLTDSGRMLGFAIMTSDFKARERYNRQSKRSLDGERKASKWVQKARAVQDSWVRYWLSL